MIRFFQLIVLLCFPLSVVWAQASDSLSIPDAGEKRTLVIGHRGAKGYAMENTITSVQKAIEMGVDVIEIDVFRCASGEIVVFHDKSLRRLTASNAKIASLSLDSLKNIPLNNGDAIPTLQQVIDVIKGRVILNIELKGDSTAAGTRALIDEAITQNSWDEGDFIVSSFNRDELRHYRTLNSDAKIAVLTFLNPLKAIDFAREINAFAINPRHVTLSKRRVNKLHDHGLRVHPWTVNKIDDIEKLVEMGVDGMITDFPDRIQLVELKLSEIYKPTTHE